MFQERPETLVNDQETRRLAEMMGISTDELTRRKQAVAAAVKDLQAEVKDLQAESDQRGGGGWQRRRATHVHTNSGTSRGQQQLRWRANSGAARHSGGQHKPGDGGEWRAAAVREHWQDRLAPHGAQRERHPDSALRWERL